MVPGHPEAAQVGILPALFPTENTRTAEGLQGEVVALFEAHRTRLLAYIVAFGIPVHDGEEIIQEVFLALFRHLQRGRSRSNLRGWIFRVAHNLALRQRQYNHRWHHTLEADASASDTFVDPAPNPEEHAVSIQRQRRLIRAVGAMPEQDQWCLRLRAEGLRYREIAGIVGISLGSVSISLTRSFTRLMRTGEL
jgi:RNA polymerase sigma-70 factor, ECF subfamily